MRADQIDFLQAVASLQGGPQEAQALLEYTSAWEEIKASLPKKRSKEEAKEDEVHTQLGLVMTSGLKDGRGRRYDPNSDSARALIERYLRAHGPSSQDAIITHLMEKKGWERRRTNDGLGSHITQGHFIRHGRAGSAVWSLPAQVAA